MPFIAMLRPENQVHDSSSVYTVARERRYSDLYCVDCDKPLKFHHKRTSETFTEHFKHATEKDENRCPRVYSGSSSRQTPGAWHRTMTSYVDYEKREIVRPHPQATERKHFADAFDSSSGIGFEFQSSDINPCDVESREEATPYLRWIYNLEKDQCHLYSIQDVNNGRYAFLELPLAWQRAIPKATHLVWFTDRHLTAVYMAVSNQISEVKLSNTQKTTPVSGCVVQAMDAPTLWNKGQFYRVRSASFPVFSDHNNYVMGPYISLSDVELSLSTSPESCSPWQTIFEKCAMEEHEQSEWYLSMCHLLQTGKNDGEGKWQVWGAKNLPPFYLKNSSCNWLFNSESFRVYYSDMAQFYVVEPLIRRWEIEFNNSDPANHVHVWGTGVPPLRLYSNVNGTFEYSLSDGSKSKIRGFIALEDKSAIPFLIPNETVKNITKEHSCVSRHEELYPCSVDLQRLLDTLMRDDICERLVPRLEKNQKLAVQAPAGSGKTTLLLTAGKRLFRKNILFITFNKELQREALSKCPSNMHPQTFDSLTREAAILHADQYRKRTDQTNQVKRSQDLGEEIHQSFRRTFPEYAQAKRKKRWWNPYDEEYDSAVNVTIARFQAFCNDASVKSPGEHRDYNYSIIKQMWRKTTGYEWITFDGMRKLCHTTNALGKFIDQNYQFVFVDEVQDLNPVMLDVLDCQVSTPCVFVGDAYQSIYGFMGTVNLFANDRWQARVSWDSYRKRPIRRQLNIFQTFRFGFPLSQEILKWFPYAHVVGRSDIYTSLEQGFNPRTATSRTTTFPGTTPNESCVYLFRKWSNLVDHIVKNKIQDNESGRFNIPGLRKKLDEWERIIRSGRTQKAKNKNDADVLRMPKTLKSLNLDDYQKTKKSLLVALRENAGVEYSTIHQSKGREADVVRVANDILVDPTQYPLDTGHGSRLDDEKCLFYVALTRARETVLVDKQEQNI